MRAIRSIALAVQVLFVCCYSLDLDPLQVAVAVASERDLSRSDWFSPDSD